MKLKFKSLQGSTFGLDVEPSDTIASVKTKIQSEHGHQATSQKIIYSGKILTDADTVQSCGVSEKEFLVLMVSKPKVPKPAAPVEAPAAPAQAPAATESSATTTATPSTTASATEPAAASLPSTTESQPAPAPAAAATAQSASTTGGSGSMFLQGTELEQAVNNIVDMGFEKSDVQAAMRASFNNPERAVEYLMTGIPAHLSQPPPGEQPAVQGSQPAPPAGAMAASTTTTPAAAAPAAAPTTAAAPAPAAPAAPRALNLFEAAAAQAQGGGATAGQGGAGAGAGGGLQGLQGMEDDGSGRSVVDLGNPAMLAQLRQLVQQNPAALAPLVQALAQTNPRLASAMAEDPEGVLNLLASGAAGGGGEGEGDEGVTLPSMDELNPEDRTAVQQIMAMGIPEGKAIEAYLMCGRNVEMAVQYYFENPQDFED